MILMRRTLHVKHVRKWGKQDRGEEAKQICGFRWNIASDDRNEPWSLLWPEIPHPPLAVSYWECSLSCQAAPLTSSSHSPDLGKGSFCDTSRICYKQRESLLLAKSQMGEWTWKELQWGTSDKCVGLYGSFLDHLTFTWCTSCSLHQGLLSVVAPKLSGRAAFSCI